MEKLNYTSAEEHTSSFPHIKALTVLYITRQDSSLDEFTLVFPVQVTEKSVSNFECYYSLQIGILDKVAYCLARACLAAYSTLADSFKSSF